MSVRYYQVRLPHKINTALETMEGTAAAVETYVNSGGTIAIDYELH